jgi:hypothetical protein
MAIDPTTGLPVGSGMANPMYPGQGYNGPPIGAGGPNPMIGVSNANPNGTGGGDPYVGTGGGLPPVDPYAGTGGGLPPAVPLGKGGRVNPFNALIGTSMYGTGQNWDAAGLQDLWKMWRKEDMGAVPGDMAQFNGIKGFGAQYAGGEGGLLDAWKAAQPPKFSPDLTMAKGAMMPGATSPFAGMPPGYTPDGWGGMTADGSGGVHGNDPMTQNMLQNQSGNMTPTDTYGYPQQNYLNNGARRR